MKGIGEQTCYVIQHMQKAGRWDDFPDPSVGVSEIFVSVRKSLHCLSPEANNAPW